MRDSFFLRDDIMDVNPPSIQLSSRLDSQNYNVKAYRKRNRTSHKHHKLLQSTEVLTELARIDLTQHTQNGTEAISARRMSATAAVGKRQRGEREFPGFTKTARTKHHSVEQPLFEEQREKTIINHHRGQNSINNGISVPQTPSPPLKKSSFSQHEREFAKGGLKNKHLQNWLNQILMEYCHQQKFDGTIEHPALKKYGIDKNSLLSKGINPLNLDRIYKSLFVYSMGFNTLLREIGSRNMNLRKTFWKVYAILLEYCSDGDFDTMIGEIERDKNRKMDVLKEEIQRRQEVIDNNEDIHQERNAKIFKELKLLRDQNTDLENDKNVLMEDYKEAEQAFNEEVSLRLKFQNKINEIHGVHRQLAIKHQKLYDDLQLRTFELASLKQKFTKLTQQHLTAKTDNDFLRKENAALREQNDFNYKMMQEMKKKATSHELLQVQWRHKKQQFAIALRERQKRVQQVRAQLKNAELMVSMKEKSQQQLQKQYKRALQQNRQLAASLQKELEQINTFMLEKKDFNDTHSRLYAEVEVTTRLSKQRSEMVEGQKRQIQALAEELRMKAVDIEVLNGKVKQHEMDTRDLFSKIAQMKQIKTIIEEELAQARSREDHYRNYYAQKEKTIAALSQKAEEDERTIAEFSLARKALQSRVTLLTQKLAAEEDSGKKRVQKLANEVRVLDQQNKALKLQLQQRLNQVEEATLLYEDTFAKLKDQLFQRNDLELRYNQSLSVVQSETDHIKKLNIRISQLQERNEQLVRKLKGAEFVLQNREKAFGNELQTHLAATANLKEQIKLKKMFVHPMKVEDLYGQIQRISEIHQRQRSEFEEQRKGMNVPALQAKIRHLETQLFQAKISHQQEVTRMQGELSAERERLQQLQQRFEKRSVQDSIGSDPSKGMFKQKERRYLQIIKQKSSQVEHLLKEVQSMHDQNSKLLGSLNEVQEQTKLRESKLQQFQSQFSQLQSEKHALNLQKASVFRERERMLAQMAEQESRVLDPDQNRNFLGVPSTARETASRQRSARLQSHSRQEGREKAMQPGWRNDFGKKVKNAFSYYRK